MFIQYLVQFFITPNTYNNISSELIFECYKVTHRYNKRKCICDQRIGTACIKHHCSQFFICDNSQIAYIFQVNDFFIPQKKTHDYFIVVNFNDIISYNI